MRKTFIIVLLAAFALSVTATAGNPSLCQKDGWTLAQDASGQGFSSRSECASAREVFIPSVTLDKGAVTALEVFWVSGAGFHASEGVTLSIAVTGQAPYYTSDGWTHNGAFTRSLLFTGCGSAPPYALTLTLTDTHGVHASASLVLC